MAWNPEELFCSLNGNDGIVLKAFGESPQLGCFFDIRTNKLVRSSIFKNYSEASNYFPEPVDCTHSGFRMAITDSSYDKFKLFHLHASSSANILLGKAKMSQSTECLNTKKSTKNEIRSTLVYTARSVEEYLNLNDERIQETYDWDAIKSNIATHFVGAIVYGGHATLTMTYANTNKYEKSAVEAGLNAALKSCHLSVNADLEGKRDRVVDISLEELTFSLDADCYSTSHFPNSPTEAKDLINIIVSEQLLIQANDNKGIVLDFVIYPLSSLHRFHKTDGTHEYLKFNTVLEPQAVALCVFFDRVNNFRLDMSATIRNLTDTRGRFITNTMREALNSINGELDIKEAQWKTLIIESISGPSIFCIEQCLLIADNDLHHLKGDLDSLVQKVQDKYSLIESVADICTYVADESWRDHCNYRNSCLILTFNHTNAAKFKQLWKENIDYLREHKKNAFFDTTKVFLLDVEAVNFFPQECEVSGIALHQWSKADKEWTFDLLANRKLSKAQKSFVRMLGPTPHSAPSDLERSMKREKKFFCTCGLGSVDQYTFRCGTKDHLQYESYGNNLAASLESMEENIITILVFGVSGVGKSTFINSLATYIQEESLEKMLKYINNLDNVAMIPAQFSYDDNGTSRTVKIGEENRDESFVKYHSATQKCKTYEFVWENCKYKIIDTPGTSDSRGYENDGINTENIMAYLENYSKVHAVLLFVDATQSRLTKEFVYGLTQFAATTAAENFCFVYTKCKYGDKCEAVRTVSELLSDDKLILSIPQNDHNQFFFDNSCFRFLVCVRDGMKCIPKEKETNIRNWNLSSSSAFKLLRHVRGLQPQDLRNAISVRLIRMKFSRLSYLIALMIAVINENKTKCRNLLSGCDLTTSIDNYSILPILPLSQIFVDIIQTPYLRTVCLDQECCTEWVAFVDEDFRSFKNRRVCEDVSSGSTLLTCECFSNQECKVCMHGMLRHMNTRVEYKTRVDLFNPDKPLLTTDQSALVQMYSSIKQRNDSLENSLKKVYEVTLRIAKYLKDNSIFPHSDSLGVLLGRVLRRENDDDFQQFFRNYQTMVVRNTVENATEGSFQTMVRPRNSSRISLEALDSVEDMQSQIETLYQIPEYGRLFRDSVNWDYLPEEFGGRFERKERPKSVFSKLKFWKTK